MRKKWLSALLIYAALMALCLVVVYAVPSVRGMLEKTYIAEFGKIDIKDEVPEAYIVRDERVYTAAQDSRITRIAEPGRLIKAGTQVVKLEPLDTEGSGDEEETAEEEKYSGHYASILEAIGDEVRVTETGYTVGAGYISYEVDGAEGRLRVSHLYDLTQEELKDLTKRKSDDTPDKKCAKGDPVFKVARNSKWYLVYFLDKEEGEKYHEGRTVTIDVGEESYPVRVESVQISDNTCKVILSCKTFYDGFLDTRRLETTVTVASAEGLILRDESIVEDAEGQKGVFVKNKLGEHVFRPISIMADDGQKCAVYADIFVDAGGNYVETIETYDEIVLEPTEEDMESISSPDPEEKK